MRSGGVFLFVAATMALMAFGITIQISVWNECRQNNSFFYCLRLVSK